LEFDITTQVYITQSIVLIHVSQNIDLSVLLYTCHEHFECSSSSGTHSAYISPQLIVLTNGNYCRFAVL